MKKYLFVSIKSFFLILLMISCKKDEEKKLPSIKTTVISEITDTSAQTGGIISNDGNDLIVERGVCWSSTVLEPDTSGDKTNDGTGEGEFVSVINGLASNTTYYVRAFATNSVGTVYGNTILFKTNTKLPSITTSHIILITQNSAQCGGNISSESSIMITARGVCWGSEPSPEISGNKTIDGTGYGEFISNITGLTANTTYYVRAYAINSDGITVYGADSVFKTLADLPTLTTTQISLITQTTAQSGGNIISDGGDSIIVRGVCWNSETLPTINDSKTIDGNGSGEFTSHLSDIIANTLYYVRAYATNSEGTTAYGNEQTFKTLQDSIKYPKTGKSGLNLLSEENNVFTKGKYSISATVPADVSLKIVIQPRDGTSLNIGIYIMDNIGWTYNSNYPTDVTLSVEGNNQTVDIPIDLVNSGKLTINYFEDSDQITKTKDIDY